MKYFVSHILVFLLIVCACETNQIAFINNAKNFTLPDVNNIERSLTDYQGNLLLLHFWADWCPHCRAEFEELEKVYSELKDQGFLIVAINVGQTAELISSIKKTYGVTFPMLRDADKSVAEQYQVKGLPASFFINSEQRILHQLNGWLKAEQIRRKFKELI